MNKYISGHTSEETAYIVKDYPWGYRMRTERRYWIETHPKRGDRSVYQTKDPRTGNWCKPKKSTYYAAMHLFLNEKGHVKSTGIHSSSTEENVKKYIDRVGEENITPEQKAQFKRIIALDKTMSHFEWTCESTYHEPVSLLSNKPEDVAKRKKLLEKEKEHKEHQKEMNKKMNRIFNYYMSK